MSVFSILVDGCQPFFRITGEADEWKSQKEVNDCHDYAGTEVVIISGRYLSIGLGKVDHGYY